MRAFPLAALLAIGFLQLAASSCRSSEPLEIEVPRPRRLERPLVNGEALHIRGLSGTILTRVDPGSPPYAELRPADHGLALERIGSALVLRVGEGSPPLALELSLPEDIALLCDSSTGFLEATGPLRSAHIRGHRGPIHLQSIAGELVISSLTGNITILRTDP